MKLTIEAYMTVFGGKDMDIVQEESENNNKDVSLGLEASYLENHEEPMNVTKHGNKISKVDGE